MRRSPSTSQRLRVPTMKSLFSRVHDEFAIVCKAIDSDESMQDREALEGWKQALRWVLEEIDKEEDQEEEKE